MTNYTLSVGTPIWRIQDSLAVRSGKFILECVSKNDDDKYGYKDALWNLSCKATGKVRTLLIKDGRIDGLGDWVPQNPL